jgi:septum formation protein
MLILASTSPTRQAMLTNAGLSFSAIAPNVDERKLVARNPQWTPEDIPLRLAEAKATEVSARHPAAIVVGADQVLALGSKVYSKPQDKAQCREQLLELRGSTHALISGIVCALQGKLTWSFSDRALLTMRNFSTGFLDSYLEAVGDDCTTSVGGYKIEGRGLQLFSNVEGDHFTILGLPLVPLLDYLRREGELLA